MSKDDKVFNQISSDSFIIIQRIREYNYRRSLMPKIQGREVTEEHIGSNVTYIPNHAMDDHTQWEHGKISSFNETGIWVRFKGPNGEKCCPENLIWG